MQPSAAPRLSIILVAGDARSHAERALQSLLHQNIIHQMEIIIMDCSLPGLPTLAGSDHPRVCTLKVPPEEDYGTIRAQGVRMAQAPLVCLFEEHSFAMPGWAEAIIAAHEGPWSAVGGEEYSAVAGEGLTDAAYLEHCIRWMPPATRGEDDSLPTHNATYKRDVLLSYGSDLAVFLTCLPLLFWKLKEDGHRMFIEPDARYLHTYVARPKVLVNQVLWSRIFSSERAQRYDWSAAQRLLRLAVSPILPLLRLARLGWFIARQRPDRLWIFLYMSPAILLVDVVSVFGETVGMLFGAGDTFRQFSHRHARGVGLI